ncbi:MAG: hypothetical protein WBZ29_04540 [Methanocella sp.]
MSPRTADSLHCKAFIYFVADTLTILMNDKKQSIHDMVAGTVVVYK